MPGSPIDIRLPAGAVRATAAVALGVAALLWPMPAAAADGTTLAVVAGRMTDDTWYDVLFEPGSLTWRDSYMAGAMLAREWPLGRAGFVGVEGQINRHWGEQDLWEIAAPLYLRSLRPESPLIPSLAYGLGLSWTSEVPAVEVDRKGESQQMLAYWFIELEFASRARTRPFVRLHHRSDAFGTFEADTGSNALLLGLRREF